MQKFLDILFYAGGVVLGILVAVYFYFFFRRYALLYREYKQVTPTAKQRLFFRILQIAASLGLGIAAGFISYVPALIIGHFFVLLVLFDGLFALIKLAVRKREKALKIVNIAHYSRALPIIICIVMLVFGAININTIRRTEYEYTSAKIESADGYDIVLVTDAHFGNVQKRSVFLEACRKIEESHPDIIVLGGDIVDENTTKEDLYEIFRIFGDMDTTYGTYFVYGNHDRNMYATGTPNFTNQELEDAITSSGITILCDDTAVINNEILLIGREDDSAATRKDIAELTAGYNLADYYTIVLDHQPNNDYYQENAALKLDLQLSGHTHGGQIFPVGIFLQMVGSPNYGEYKVADFSAIVSSGITGWGYPFRTEGVCEYVVVRVDG